jgi:hypothetical protein
MACVIRILDVFGDFSDTVALSNLLIRAVQDAISHGSGKSLYWPHPFAQACGATPRLFALGARWLLLAKRFDRGYEHLRVRITGHLLTAIMMHLIKR